MRGIADSIDKLVTTEFRRSGVLDGVIHPLARAARELTDGDPPVWAAAKRLIDASHVDAKGVYYIATGHVHPKALPVGETDGPLGAAALARSLVLATANPVVILCEDVVVPVMEATCRAAGLVVRDESDLPAPRSVAVVPFPTDREHATRTASLMAEQAAAVVTVEKIGHSASGEYFTGVGNDVSDHLAKVDVLVKSARERGTLTIGIGDLGNEIGMSRLRTIVSEVVPNGDRICCDVETDIIVAAACSNWGAYGISASLAALKGDIDLMHTGTIELEMIKQSCRAGAVDGFSTGPTMEVDGAPMEMHVAFVELLRGVTAICMDTRKPIRFSGIED